MCVCMYRVEVLISAEKKKKENKRIWKPWWWSSPWCDLKKKKNYSFTLILASTDFNRCYFYKSKLIWLNECCVDFIRKESFSFSFSFSFSTNILNPCFFFINIRKRVKGEEENDRGFFHNNKLHKIGYTLVVQLMKKIIVGSSCPPPSMLTTTTTTTTKTTTIIRNTHWSWCYRRLTVWFKKIIEYCILQGSIEGFLTCSVFLH